MKTESEWFSHDATARRNPKMIALRAVWGMAGYGMWWTLVEMLRDRQGYRYSVQRKFGYASLAHELEVSLEDAQKFIRDCLDFDLIETDGEYIWSEGLLERMHVLDAKRSEMAEKGRKGGYAARGKSGRPPKKLPDDEHDSSSPPSGNSTNNSVGIFNNSAGINNNSPTIKKNTHTVSQSFIHSESGGDAHARDENLGVSSEGNSGEAFGSSSASSSGSLDLEPDDAVPSLESVVSYMAEQGCRNPRQEAESFVEYKSDKGWGRNWRASANRWLRQIPKYGPTPSLKVATQVGNATTRGQGVNSGSQAAPIPLGRNSQPPPTDFLTKAPDYVKAGLAKLAPEAEQRLGRSGKDSDKAKPKPAPNVLSDEEAKYLTSQMQKRQTELGIKSDGIRSSSRSG